MMKTKLLLIPLLSIVGGCYEDANITLHKPHVYQGKIDKHAERPHSLDARFNQTQTDR